MQSDPLAGLVGRQQRLQFARLASDFRQPDGASHPGPAVQGVADANEVQLGHQHPLGRRQPVHQLVALHGALGEKLVGQFLDGQAFQRRGLLGGNRRAQERSNDARK